MTKSLLFLLLCSFVQAKPTECFSFSSQNSKSKIKSLRIETDSSSNKLSFTLTLKQAFVVEKAMYDSLESQIQASKLQIEKREHPYLNPAESTLISAMASMDDKRPRSYREAYDQYQTRQYNRVMNRLENPQDYYQHSSNNNNYFEKQVTKEVSSVLIPGLILGLKNGDNEVFFKAEDKYDIKVVTNSKTAKNISYERNKETLKFKYTLPFKFNEISLALIDDDDNIIEYLSNSDDNFDYRGAWHLLKKSKLLPFQKIHNKNLFIKK
jgi:hypothetical protein